MSAEQERALKLERFLAQDPSNTVLMRDLAATFQAAGDFDRARHYFEMLRRETGDDPVLLNALGSLYLALDEPDAAIDALSIALKLDPEAAPLLFNLGYCEFTKENSAGARDLFREALKKEPRNTEYRYFLALAHSDLGDYEASIHSLNTLLSIDPDHLRGSLFLALNELKSGQMEQARNRAERILEKNPRSIEALHLKAEISLLAFKAEEALATLRQAESIDPDNGQTQLLLGQSLLILQRVKQAKQAFSRASSASSRETAASGFVGLGWVLLLNDGPADAKEAFNHALALKPDDADAHTGLAMALLAKECLPQAEQHLTSALNVNPNHVTALMLQQAISEKRGDQAESHSRVLGLMQERRFNPFGWSLEEVSARFGESKAGQRVLNKYQRYIRMKTNSGHPKYPG